MEQFHVVHITPTFAAAGAQMRTAGILNHLGARFRHTVISQNDDFTATAHIDRSVRVECRRQPNCGSTPKTIRVMREILREQKPDLVFTYNWGSMDAVAAALVTRVAPVLHFEDGFGADEAIRQKRRRVLYRRLVLPYTRGVIAPSRNLARIMRDIWKLPEDKIHYIPNGIDLDRFTPAPADRPEGDEIVVGSVGHLRSEKRQDRLIEACAEAGRTRKIRLLLAGEGPERTRLEQKARSLGFHRQVEFLGHVIDPREVYRRLDIFALSSCTEQMPISVLEAMASGLPVLSTDVGDIRNMVSGNNHAFVIGDFAGYIPALLRLARDGSLRRSLGAGNRAHCEQAYPLDHMLGRHQALYERTLASKGTGSATGLVNQPRASL